jgi:Rieske Fe-S protein
VVELAEIERDKARVVRVNGELIAAYRNDSGTLTAVSAKCTHMGCIVHWNDSERTWHCPCHEAALIVMAKSSKARATFIRPKTCT